MPSKRISEFDELTTLSGSNEYIPTQVTAGSSLPTNAYGRVVIPL